MAEPAVVLILFRRPGQTARVLEALRGVRPALLFVLADAPRPTHPEDEVLCRRTRDLVDTIDWPCTVHRLFAESHLGLARRVISGMDAVFERVEEVIILEDDCVPAPSFFLFCHHMLERFRREERVAMICGSNPLEFWRDDRQSFHFSAVGSHWGWATWRRVWERVDFTMSALQSPDLDGLLADCATDRAFVEACLKLCRSVAAGRLDTWDSPWTLNQLLQGSLAVVPARNLITNTGFDRQGTHTVGFAAGHAALPCHSLTPPYRGPGVLAPDRDYDHRIARWRAGRPAADDLLRRIDSLLAEGRAMAALVLAVAFRTADLPARVDQRASIEQRAVEARARLRAGANRP